MGSTSNPTFTGEVSIEAVVSQATELARLRAENERLREAGERAADQLESYLTTYSPVPDNWDVEGWAALRAARAALQQSEDSCGT